MAFYFPLRLPPRLFCSARQSCLSSQARITTAAHRTLSLFASLSPTRELRNQIITPKIILANNGARSLSTIVMPAQTIAGNRPDFGATTSLLPIPPQRDAENFAAYAHANRHQKVKPFIIKRRIKQLRTYIGEEKNIRHSPWRMNLVCQFAAGLTVPEALKQLMFCQKRMAPLVAKVIRDTANKADRKDGLQPSQLEVAECFSTHGTHLKRLKIMGRGRAGKKHRRHSHIRLVLREIDFPTKLLEAKSINQKRKWLEYLRKARDDYEKAKVDRAELEELEAMAAQLEEEARKKREEDVKS